MCHPDLVLSLPSEHGCLVFWMVPLCDGGDSAERCPHGLSVGIYCEQEIDFCGVTALTWSLVCSVA